MEYEKLKEKLETILTLPELPFEEDLTAVDCKQMYDILCKIEQGTLIELPCKVGDWIWVVCGTISEYQISEFWYDGRFFVFKCTNVEYVQEHRDFSFFDERIGKTVFLTREEAEQRLKELQNG